MSDLYALLMRTVSMQAVMANQAPESLDIVPLGIWGGVIVMPIYGVEFFGA